MTKISDKINSLWITFLLGTLFHTQLGLMPLFHGQNIAHSHETGSIDWILWLMLLFFIVPSLAIISNLFSESYQYRVFHFWLTVVYSVLNFIHLVMDLFVSPIAWYQIALMAVLLGIGLILNVVSYQWMKIRSLKENYHH
ncbi:conserved hypothetical protein [Gloeothece citriformis PCC 7424]|uniref:Uncharacterized protein n=1 Tax=Gloeothece citriformis (strain PCC 7424) TaxID=65393 RepID=B7KAG3_GLOC7|nr:hypothetical protein [Gloeothece citriformis]ACK72937.1 conserved hypothetical protein [Gloeothece citriformis PCC 7424]